MIISLFNYFLITSHSVIIKILFSTELRSPPIGQLSPDHFEHFGHPHMRPPMPNPLIYGGMSPPPPPPPHPGLMFIPPGLPPPPPPGHLFRQHPHLHPPPPPHIFPSRPPFPFPPHGMPPPHFGKCCFILYGKKINFRPYCSSTLYDASLLYGYATAIYGRKAKVSWTVGWWTNNYRNSLWYFSSP